MTKSQKRNKSKRGKPLAEKKYANGFFSEMTNSSNLMFLLFTVSLLVVVPLVYSSRVLDPALHIRLLALAAFLLIFTVFINVVKKRDTIGMVFLKNKIIWFWVAYFVITAVSTLWAYNYKESIFDIVKTFSTLTLIVLAVLVFDNVSKWPEKLSIIVLIASIVPIFIGFNQFYQRVMLATTDKAPDGDALIYLVKGLMAHKNMYSSSLMLMLPFLGFGIYKFRGFLRFVFAIAGLAIMVIILLLSTRSVWLGIILAFLGSVVVLVVSGSYFNLGLRLRRWAAVVSVLVFAIGITIIYTQEGTSHYSIIERLKSIVRPDSSNNPYRLKIWDISLSMAKDKPLTGVGAGNWKIESPRYYQGYGFKKDQLNWVRPHNDFLWVLSEKGIAGLIIFMGFFAAFFYYIYKIWSSGASVDRKVFALLIFGGIIGYITDSMFSFPLERIDQQVYLGLMAASVITLNNQDAEKKEQKGSYLAMVIPAIMMLVFTIFYCISEIKMEIMVRKAREYHTSQDWKRLLDLSVRIPTTFRDIDPEVMPVKWYQALALANLDKTAEARDVYLEAVKANPTRINVLNNLGRTYFQLGDYENARKIFEQALAILPDYFESTVNMASTLYQLKDYQKSLEYWERIPKQKRNEPILNNIEMVKRKLQKE